MRNVGGILGRALDRAGVASTLRAAAETSVAERTRCESRTCEKESPMIRTVAAVAALSFAASVSANTVTLNGT